MTSKEPVQRQGVSLVIEPSGSKDNEYLSLSRPFQKPVYKPSSRHILLIVNQCKYTYVVNINSINYLYAPNSQTLQFHRGLHGATLETFSLRCGLKKDNKVLLTASLISSIKKSFPKKVCPKGRKIFMS